MRKSDAQELADAAERYQAARRVAGEEIPLREAIRRVSARSSGARSFAEPKLAAPTTSDPPKVPTKKSAGLAIAGILGGFRAWVEGRYGADAAETAVPRAELARAAKAIAASATDRPAADVTTTAADLAEAAERLVEDAASLGRPMMMREAIYAVGACPLAFAETVEVQIALTPIEVKVPEQEAQRLAKKYPIAQPMHGVSQGDWEVRHRALLANAERRRVAMRVQAAGAIATGAKPEPKMVAAALDGESDVNELARLALEIRKREGVSVDDAVRAALLQREPEVAVYLDTIPAFTHATTGPAA